MAKQQVVIGNVTRFLQGGMPFYTFPLDADELLAIGVVLRFNDHADGVNRAFTTNHALKIASYMRNAPNPLFIENICGDLRGAEGDGEWIFNEKARTLTGTIETDPEHRLDGCTLVIDDGQHRMAALQLLNGDERKRFPMLVNATMGASVELRLHLFRQQTTEKRQPRRLQWAIDFRRGTLKPTQLLAYRIALRLNTDPGSPLQGRIYFGQDARVPKKHLNVLGLLAELRTCVGKQSALHGLTKEVQTQFIYDFLSAAARQWPSSWNKEDRVLGRSLGICALIRLISTGGQLHMALDGDRSIDNIAEVLKHGKSFRWETDVTTGSVNTTNLAHRLHEFIGPKALGAMRAKETDLAA